MIECRFKDAHRMIECRYNMIKQKLKKTPKIYRKFVKNKFDLCYKQLINVNMLETSNLLSSAKESYYKNEGKMLPDPSYMGPKLFFQF